MCSYCIIQMYFIYQCFFCHAFKQYGKYLISSMSLVVDFGLINVLAVVIVLINIINNKSINLHV